MKKSTHNGFTMIDALLGLSVSLLVSFLSILCLECVSHMLKIPLYQQDQMAVLQLRSQMALIHAYEIQGEDLVYIWNHEEYTITYDRRRLVKQKGYEILMENIDGARFYEHEEKVYLTYQKNNQTFTYQIL